MFSTVSTRLKRGQQWQWNGKTMINIAIQVTSGKGNVISKQWNNCCLATAWLYWDGCIESHIRAHTTLAVLLGNTLVVNTLAVLLVTFPSTMNCPRGIVHALWVGKQLRDVLSMGWVQHYGMAVLTPSKTSIASFWSDRKWQRLYVLVVLSFVARYRECTGSSV